jgi:paraquat-inducible protein B
MSKKGNPKVIGAFVVGAAILLVVGVMIFGSGKFFRKTHRYVLFFPGSIKGLNVGSPVTLEGVRIGEVVDYKAVYAISTDTFHAPVYIEVTEGNVMAISEDLKVVDWEGVHSDPDEEIKELVELGLRAQLDLQSIVTGQLGVALALHPEKPANFVGLDKRYPEIPTIPTDLQMLGQMLREIPIKDIVDNVQDALAGIKDLATSPELAGAIKNLDQTLDDFGALARNLDSQVGPLVSSIEETMGDTRTLVKNVNNNVEPIASGLKEAVRSAQKAMEEAEQALAAIQDMAGRQSPLYSRIDETLAEVSGAARRIRFLADFLERNPDALLFGRGKSGGQ